MENLIENEDFKRLSNLSTWLGQENSMLKSRICELEEKIKVLNNNVEFLSDAYRHDMMRVRDMTRKFDEVTLPMLQNLVAEDRFKIREKIYGKDIYQPNY